MLPYQVDQKTSTICCLANLKNNKTTHMPIELLKSPTSLMKARRPGMTLNQSHHCTMQGHVAACWLRLVMEKGGQVWITKTTSCPSLIFSPLEAGHQSSWDLHPKPEAQVFAANVCEPKKSLFPGTFGPGYFSGVYVWSWLWLMWNW